MSYHETLGLSAAEFESVADHFEEASFRGREYRHLPDYQATLDRGVVLIDGSVVAGYPKVPRTLVLSEGVPRHFEGRVAVEEKLDGYNTRVARVGDDVLAFTRSGIVCPFTTHVVRDRLDCDAFFGDHPDLMLCGEMVGPENPYTVHDYPGVDSIAFRAFDVRERESGEPLSVRERRDLCDRYDVPRVPFHGIFDREEAVDRLRTILADLDERGREGVVMKSPDVDQQLKYTTASANQGDLAYAFSLPFDYGRDFMFRRLIREAFQSVEFNESGDERRERAHEVGEAIVEPMVEAIETVADGEEVGERHTVRAEPSVVEDLFDHFRDMGLTVRVEDDRREDGERVVTFRKRTQATNDKIRSYLDGQIVRE